ncbi:MAG: DUF2391 family protein [Candidatus Woesearchaeota archaeon]
MKTDQDIKAIKKRILGEEAPEHFGRKDIVRSFFGAMLFGLTFVFKGLLFQISKNLQEFHIFLIILTTIIVLTLEIYFIGYSRVENKKQRPFGQFWFKRIAVFYAVAIFTTLGLIYIYGLADSLTTFEEVQLVIALSLPCAVGASLADLLKQY